MKDIPLKYDDDKLYPEEWNSIISEMKNFIESADIDLSASENYQIAQSIATYAMVSDFYIDSGAPNNYILSISGKFKAPTEYKDGMRVRFQVLNTNTGTSTINVCGLGIKNIKKYGGFNLLKGEFKSNDYVELIYNSSLNYFIPLRSQKLSIGCANQFVYLDLGYNFVFTNANSLFDKDCTFGSGANIPNLNISITPVYNQSYLIAELTSNLYIPSSLPSQNLYYVDGQVAMYVNPTSLSLPISQTYTIFEKGAYSETIQTPALTTPFTLKGVYINNDLNTKTFKINIGQYYNTNMYPATICLGSFVRKANTIIKITEIKI